MFYVSAVLMWLGGSRLAPPCSGGAASLMAAAQPVYRLGCMN